MILNAQTRLGPYLIIAPLGAGGMGEVYRARDTRLDRDVAIKVLPEHLARDAAALARFHREAKTIAALSHPNIVAIHDVGSDRRRAGGGARQGSDPPRRQAGEHLPHARRSREGTGLRAGAPGERGIG